MFTRRCDRYILRGMSGPFLVSLFGLMLFILLNLIISLSDLMVDRGVGIALLGRLMLFKLPGLIVLAIPVAGLFTTFLGLERMIHDREIMAMESSGISLRRILTPLLVAACLLVAIDFCLYNFLVPVAERSYQRVLRGIILGSGALHIRENTFLKGSEGQFFYVRRYDEQRDTLHGILIYDVEGRLFPQMEAAITIITSEEGRWAANTWELKGGQVYGYDRSGRPIHTASFDQLSISMTKSASESLFGARTPTEMGIGELRKKISILKGAGLPADALILESHAKLAIPMATLVFTLFGGAVSLMFGWRSRAIGVILSLFLVGLFQGILLWTQTLGRKGIIPPSIAAWIPDIIFGLLGTLLFCGLDRLSHHDWGRHVRRLLTFFTLILIFSWLGLAEEPWIAIECGAIDISEDRRQIHAHDGVLITYGKTRLSAEQVTLIRTDNENLQLCATTDVNLSIGEEYRLSGEELSALLVINGDTFITKSAKTNMFHGRSTFVNSAGERHVLLYQGKKGQIDFDSTGAVEMISITEGELTTCECGEGGIRGQPYSIETKRLNLYMDRLVVAFDLTVRSFGRRVLWLPVYVQPLKETLENPLFPTIGRSELHGWFLKWNIPFYLNTNNYGTVLFDYFNRFHELGLGTVLHYTFGPHQGKARLYLFPALREGQTTELYINHSMSLTNGWKLNGGLSYNRGKDETGFTFSSVLERRLSGWRLRLAAERVKEEEDEAYRIIDRSPTISVSQRDIGFGPVYLSPRIEVGWFRELEQGGLPSKFLRVEGSLRATTPQLSILGLSLGQQGEVKLADYSACPGHRYQTVLSLRTSLYSDTLDLAHTYRRVGGESPFSFDRLSPTNHITWRVIGAGTLSLRLNGGIDLMRGTMDPLILTTSWGDMNRLTLSATYRPDTAILEPILLIAHCEDEQREVSLQGKFDLGQGRLTRLYASTEVHNERGWGLNLSGHYEWKEGLQGLKFGLFRDLCDCLRIGIELGPKEIWFYTSILAFPETIFRYSPG